MRSTLSSTFYNGKLLKDAILQSVNLIRINSLYDISKPLARTQAFAEFSTKSTDDMIMGNKKLTLAENLAGLLEESSDAHARKIKSRMELKRSIEYSIKKRVKEQYKNGKFQHLMEKVISDPATLEDAYNCIRLNSNADITLNNDEISFSSLGKLLFCNNFNVDENTFRISRKGAKKEVLVLPNLKLKVIQEAIRIVLEVVYKPYFSKVSHGCRSGKGHHAALKYISKEVHAPDWWFTVLLNKRLDTCILDKLLLVMEERIDDPGLYAIIRSMFDAQVLNLEFGGFPKGHGLPQEGVLSPILMNIYLDLFDREFYRLSMKYEALAINNQNNETSHSKLRSWFRRHLKVSDLTSAVEDDFSSRVHCCRFMDEIFFAISGSNDVALAFKSEVLNYLQISLHLDINDQTELLSCEDPQGICFLGTLLKRSVRKSPATRAVHKLKGKIELFAIQKRQAWDTGTVRLGKKCLGYGLKKVKESEIPQLADSGSVLSQISHFRKSGMKTDHWFKQLLKIWMQGVNLRARESEETILSKYVAEPALPPELRNSFYEFQMRVEEYIQSETTSTFALLQNSGSATKQFITRIIAPVNAIRQRLIRYGLTNTEGHPHKSSFLILQDHNQIIDWFAGLVRRWLRWYAECDNFNEIKLLISFQVRKSCIRTLASKYRIHESIIEKKFDTELSRIPSSLDTEQEMVDEMLDIQAFENDEALMYGISYSGLILLSLARMVSESEPCNCFVFGCFNSAPSVYTLHVMGRQKFPGWKTGFSTCIHPSLNRRRIGLCKQHLGDLYLGNVSLQSIDFGFGR